MYDLDICSSSWHEFLQLADDSLNKSKANTLKKKNNKISAINPTFHKSKPESNKYKPETKISKISDPSSC